MTNRIVFLVIALLYACVLHTSAQPLDPKKNLSQYNIDHWRSDDLPTGGIIDMLQTSDGYLWFATFSNLIRFDGVEFTIFDKFNVPEFQSGGFRSLYEDPKGNFWIGANGGGLYLKQKDKFKRFVVPFGNGSNNIKTIYRDKFENLWLGTIKGLVKFNGKEFNLIIPEGVQANIDFSVFDILEDQNGKIWLATKYGVYQLENEKFVKPAWVDERISGEILKLENTPEGLWIASYNYGVFKYDGNVLTKPQQVNILDHPNTLFKDKQDGIWVGTEMGLIRCNEYGCSSINDASGLNGENIVSVLEDHEGSVWVGTYYGGLNRLRDGAFTNYTTLNGLTDNTIHVIHQSDKKIYVGTENGINCYENGSFKVCQGLASLNNKRIRDIFEDSSGRLWICTYSGLYVQRNGRLDEITIQDGLSNNQTRVVMEDKEGTIWVGTRGGLNRYKGGYWTTYGPNEGLDNTFVTDINQTRNGDLLVFTTAGIYRYVNDRFENYKVNGRKSNRTFFRSYEDKDGNIWVGSNSGLIRIKGNRLFDNYKSNPNLGSNIYDLLEDNNEVMWLTSDKGIIRIPRADLLREQTGDSMIYKPTIFDKSNGLRSNQVTSVSSAAKLTNGELWFPTLDGLATINPGRILINEVPPPIVVDNVMISGKKVNKDGLIVVPPNHKNIEIHYTGLSYMIPKKVRFRYMLEGYDEDWQDVGDRRTAYFSYLPPGNYTFKIAACNNDGIWNVKEQALVFVVERAFWQTPIFYFMVIIVGALFVAGIIHYRTRSVHRLNRLLEEKIDERTSEVLNQKEEIEAQRDAIEEKNKELESARNELQQINENLEETVKRRTKEVQKAYADLVEANKELDDFVYKSSHDVKGPLARLQGLAHLAYLEGKGTSAEEYIVKLREEANLANFIIQKLSHAHFVKNAKVNPTSFNLKEDIYEYLKKVIEQHPELKFEFKLTMDDKIVIRSDEKLLGQIFYNLFENAIIFGDKNMPVVKVKVVAKDDKLVVEVSDNGTGIEDAIKDDIYKLFFKGNKEGKGTGLGLYIAQKASEAIGAELMIKSSNEKGTTFKLILPFDKAV